MKRLVFFLALSLLLIMAALPFRLKAFAEYGHSHAAGEREYYFACLDRLNSLRKSAGDQDDIHRSMLEVARALAVLKQHRAADQMYRDVWQARSSAKSSYDEIFIGSVMGLAALRRDTGNIAGSISCYSVAFDYDKRHLSSTDIRLTRDKTNLAIANFLAAKEIEREDQRMPYLRKAAGLLGEAIAEERSRKPEGSWREANARQDLAYVLKSLNDKRGYELEMKAARAMQCKAASKRVCFEP